MRDLNLGPDSRNMVERYRKLDSDQRTIEQKANEIYSLACQMANMIERWTEVGWCWIDAAPARICGGPHVRVRYTNSKLVEVIEPANKVGETFPDVPHTIIR